MAYFYMIWKAKVTELAHLYMIAVIWLLLLFQKAIKYNWQDFILVALQVTPSISEKILILALAKIGNWEWRIQ